MAAIGRKRVTNVALSGFGSFPDGNAVEFVGPRPIRNICMLCDVLYRSISVFKCSRTYCPTCSAWTMEQSGLCPFDGNPLRFSDANCIGLDEPGLAHYTVRCLNAPHGCFFEGRLADLEDHVRAQCLYNSVTCRTSAGQSSSQVEDHCVPWHGTEEATAVYFSGPNKGGRSSKQTYAESDGTKHSGSGQFVEGALIRNQGEQSGLEDENSFANEGARQKKQPHQVGGIEVDEMVFDMLPVPPENNGGDVSQTIGMSPTPLRVQCTGEGEEDRKTKPPDRFTTMKGSPAPSYPSLPFSSGYSSSWVPLDARMLTEGGREAGSVDTALLLTPMNRAASTTEEMMSANFTAERAPAPEGTLSRAVEQVPATEARLPAEGRAQDEEKSLASTSMASFVEVPSSETQDPSVDKDIPDASKKGEASTLLIAGTARPPSSSVTRLQTSKAIETEQEAHLNGATVDSGGDAPGEDEAASSCQNAGVHDAGDCAEPVMAHSSRVKVSEEDLGACGSDATSEAVPCRAESLPRAALREMNRFSKAIYMFFDILRAESLLKIHEEPLMVGARGVLYGYTFRAICRFRRLDDIIFFQLGLFFCPGKYDEFCSWPFDKKIFLEIVHPRKDANNIRMQLCPSQAVAALAFRKPVPGSPNPLCLSHEYPWNSALTAGFVPISTLRVEVAFE